MNKKLARMAVLTAVALSTLLALSQQTSVSRGIAVASMNPAVKPGDDFFEYSNGAWLKKMEIPADRSQIGVFSSLDDLSNKRMAGLIQEAAKSGSSDATKKKIADLYNSYMDEAGIESKGITPLKPHLDAIRAIKDKRELARALGETLRADVDALNNTNYHTPNLFGLWVAPDFNDSDHYTPYLLQGGLQLPDREYYLDDSERMRGIRTKYEAHIAAMFKLASFDRIEERAKNVLALELAIAERHQSLAENEDIHKANNPWNKSDFSAKAPGLDWDQYFDAAGLAKQQKFIVWQPKAFAGEASLVESIQLDSWKDWLVFHLIESNAGVLPRLFTQERFNFVGKILSGTSEQRPRWQRGVYIVDGFLGDDLGKIYAQRYFSPEAKAAAQAMVANIVAAFRTRIEALSWMDPKTKAEAQEKLNTLYVGVGYPETWHDYSGYEVKADDIFGNLWRGEMFEYQRQIHRIGNNVDRKEWSMTPQTVNAVNLPLQNALSFPAAILQPPFFDDKAPAAVNYGAIGSVIGHEISHTFDSEGAAFDSKGRVRNWWTDADLQHFNASTAKLAAQYDTYKPFPDLALNGKQILAENIADVAGISAAYDGYRASLANKEAPVQDGFSGDQQFFIAFGQNYAEKVREDSLRQQVLTDSHAPAQYRSYTVRNLDPWYRAFDVKPGEKLYLAPEERVRIW
ncbi:MAG: M13 family metallopeptidase [Acidobacteriota bacterium]|nr:M13 family metallopeptidase [Acidobacteriota bacterium]